MQPYGERSRKVAPTPFKRFLGTVFLLRAVLNFYTIFSSFRDAMLFANVTEEYSGVSEVDYIVPKRVVAFMELLYMCYKVCKIEYRLVYLHLALAKKIEYYQSGSSSNLGPNLGTAPSKRLVDRTEDAHKFTGRPTKF